MIMKRSVTTALAVFIAITFLVGCVSTPMTKSSSSSGSGGKVAAPASYSQVPASLRGPVKEAEFDLRQAKEYSKLANEKVKLAELQKEWALLNDKNAGYEKKLAEVRERKAEIVVEVKMAEAIDNAGLGDKEENIKNIASLKTKELDITSDEIKIKADIDTTELKLKRLNKQIRSQKAAVAKAAGYKSKKSGNKVSKKSKK
jgi:hypothetical protein